MAMRSQAKRSRTTVGVSLERYGWDRATLATLRHCSLPWHEGFTESAAEIEIEATPLTALRDLGGRDRLSLLGQFAAHHALLQFAGITDGELDPGEWVVMQKRGTDCRLLRIAAHACDAGDAPPALTLLQQFAEIISAPELQVLKHSWARAEAAYQEVQKELRDDAAADLRWLQASASGVVLAPGPEMLRRILAQRGGTYSFSDGHCVEAIAGAVALGEGTAVVELGRVSGFLPQRCSAIEPLLVLAEAEAAWDETRIVERAAEALASKRVVFVVVSTERLDPASRTVIQMLANLDAAIWVLPESRAPVIARELVPLPASEHFVISPSLAARRELHARLAAMAPAARDGWIASFVNSAGLARYLDDGDLPAEAAAAAVAALLEPARSYLAALALIGRRIPIALASRFLEEFLFREPMDMLASIGVASIDDGSFVFENDAVREQLMSIIPEASRPGLCLLASTMAEESGDWQRAAMLLFEADEPARATEILESKIEWPSRTPEQTIKALRKVPRAALAKAPGLATTYARALIESARYRDAREIGALLPEHQREIVLARCERRTGEYGSALARVERLPAAARTFESEILRGELLFLDARYEEAKAAFAACAPLAGDDAEARLRLAYARATIANELNEPFEDEWPAGPSRLRDFLSQRLIVYRSTYGERKDVATATEAATRAVALAATATERIDAALDLIFSMFSAGRWEEARREAMTALTAVEETQGDRGAAGFLLMLGFLCADDGQWAQAKQRTNRLRQFFTRTNDICRDLDLDLLAAHLDFCRARFEEARRSAMTVAAEAVLPQIREAVALILDETDWIEGRDEPLRSTGRSGNVELADRHRLLLARRGLPSEPIAGAFTARLADWETRRLRDATAAAPVPSTGTESLKLMRSAMGLARRLRDAQLATLAEDLGRKLGLDSIGALAPVGATVADLELRVLRAAAAREFPYATHDLGQVGWRFATRNRLGQWQVIGSMPAIEPAELDRIAASPAADWLECSERELLYLDGISGWSPESREALRAIFAARSELHRLRRVAAQDETVREHSAPEAPDGIIGDSAPMREVYLRITRIARRDVPVCILGESGTGKELVARAIHRNSPRRGRTFTPVNCAALPENLIESELFGHVRGAFTGADRDRPGLIETTDGGTLFLDEIGEMPMAAQAKLLRFLQEGEFRRVGDGINRTADVRIVTATNRKLEQAVEEGRFREDLYYRICGVEIDLPPLRDRTADIPPLAAHFLAREKEKHRGGPARLSEEAEAVFLSYAWPGNVRELQNTIRAAHAMAGEAKEIDLEHLPERLRRVAVVRTTVSSYQDAVTRFRRELIEKSLNQAGGNQNQAAALLNMSRQALAYQVRELGILVRPRGRGNA
ncbi:MAG TPA: sigma 54-interacting transcriptional regulator [Thermoanaerobaculia bacterium]|nr:sigma 54-interacting transcriptional regulator [Thermoanaerobaculia bacterium]